MNFMIPGKLYKTTYNISLPTDANNLGDERSYIFIPSGSLIIFIGYGVIESLGDQNISLNLLYKHNLYIHNFWLSYQSGPEVYYELI